MKNDLDATRRRDAGAPRLSRAEVANDRWILNASLTFFAIVALVILFFLACAIWSRIAYD